MRYFDDRAGTARISAYIWLLGAALVRVLTGSEPTAYFFLGMFGLYLVAAEIIAAIEERS
ncbi:MAG TPA: hypothetical protein VK659_19465 [Asanoa sp.]|nr:hypothetical protein [Asanoa sp.]